MKNLLINFHYKITLGKSVPRLQGAEHIHNHYFSVMDGICQWIENDFTNRRVTTSNI